MWISLNLQPWFVPPVHLFLPWKKRLSLQLSLGAIARLLLRCAWRFSRDVSNQCRCHGLLSKFQYLDACSWGQQRMEGQGHGLFMAGVNHWFPLTRPYLRPLFLGGRYVGGGGEELICNGYLELRCYRYTAWSFLFHGPKLVYFTSRCWGIIIPFEFWDFAS